MHGSERYTIERGVKQGDVISPILFNAGLEHAMRKWKAKLLHHGVQLGHGNRLTNIRYADDLMLFATSSEDLIYMLETLIPELAACGLQLNSAKTKILTTYHPPLDPGIRGGGSGLEFHKKFHPPNSKLHPPLQLILHDFDKF